MNNLKTMRDKLNGSIPMGVDENEELLQEQWNQTHAELEVLKAEDEHKEITIPQLKDMVVLKRNDVSDATHTDGHYSFYVGKDKNYFFSSCDKAWRGTWKNVEILKPIEKPMKEYLVKNQHDEYVFLNDVSCVPSEFVIEVPEGMNYAYKDEFNIHFTKLEVGYRDSIIVWQRETLNDKVASAEAARQENLSERHSLICLSLILRRLVILLSRMLSRH